MREQIWYKNLIEQALEDEHYQSCLEEVKRWEPIYLAQRNAMTEMQTRVLESYISACEELDYALLRGAMKLNRIK